MSSVQTTRDPRTAQLDILLRQLLRRAISACPLSAAQIADELTKQTGRTINEATVNAWRAETKHAWHLPADVVPALCEIVRDDLIQRQLLSPKLRDAMELGESALRLCSLLEKALAEARELAGRTPRKARRRKSRRRSRR